MIKSTYIDLKICCVLVLLQFLSYVLTSRCVEVGGQLARLQRRLELLLHWHAGSCWCQISRLDMQ